VGRVFRVKGGGGGESPVSSRKQLCGFRFNLVFGNLVRVCPFKPIMDLVASSA